MANDTSSRIKHATANGFAHDVPTKHQFGTPEEIAARVGGSIAKPLTDSLPSNFRQLGPASPGGNMNDRRPTGRSGNQKFGNPHSHGA